MIQVKNIFSDLCRPINHLCEIFINQYFYEKNVPFGNHGCCFGTWA